MFCTWPVAARSLTRFIVWGSEYFIISRQLVAVSVGWSRHNLRFVVQRLGLEIALDAAPCSSQPAAGESQDKVQSSAMQLRLLLLLLSEDNDE